MVRNGRVAALRPASEDPAPSPIGDDVANAQRDPSRIRQPMVPLSWLCDGPGPAAGRRGNEPFVAVSWEDTPQLAADELSRIRGQNGNESIHAGSWG